MFSKRWQQSLKIIVITSLCWCILDVWIISYFSNCASNSPSLPRVGRGDGALATNPILKEQKQSERSESEGHGDSVERRGEQPKDSGFFDKILPDGICQFAICVRRDLICVTGNQTTIKCLTTRIVDCCYKTLPCLPSHINYMYTATVTAIAIATVTVTGAVTITATLLL